jgi:hypothetical protein
MGKMVRRLKENIKKYAEGGAVTMILYGYFLIHILTKLEEALELRAKLQLHLEIMYVFHYTNLYEPPIDVTAHVSSVSMPPPPPQAEKDAENRAKFSFHCTDLHGTRNY